MGSGRVSRQGLLWRALLASAALFTLAAVAAPAAPAKPLTTAIVLVKFPNAPNEEIPPVDEGLNTLFEGSKSVNAYLEYISGGKVSLSGRDHARAEVYGPYTIPSQNLASTPCGQQYKWNEEAKAEAKKAGVNLEGYDRIIWGLPRLRPQCGWDGLANMPGQNVWQNGNWGFGVLAHEIGHTFGWSHAGLYKCESGGQRVPLAPAAQCKHEGGGDPWNLMGVGAARTPDAFRMNLAEFINRDQRQIVTRSGEYTISPMQPVNGAGTKLLRIPRNNKGYLDLEFRQPHSPWDDYAADDPVVNGVSARLAFSERAPGSIGPGGTTALIDTKPATEIFNDAPLAVGQTLEDPETGIKVTTKSVGPNGAVVDVELPYTPDVQPPTKPADLKTQVGYGAAPGSANLPVKLNWTASTDDVGVAGYRIYRGFRHVGTTNGPETTYTDEAPRNTQQQYYVEAFDKWGYASEHSAHTVAIVTEPAYAPRVDVSFPADQPKVVLNSRTLSDVRLNPTIFERDGKNLGFNADHRWEDRNVEAGKTYRYAIKSYTIYGAVGPATTCEVTVPGNGSQGSANCTAPAGVPMTPKSGRREGGPLGNEDEPFVPRAGHHWAGTGAGAPAFWVDGHHIEHWTFDNICPGDHVANSTIFSNRHIPITADGMFRYHGHAMQEFANGRSHETRVLFRGHLGAKKGTVTVVDEHPGCHFEGEGSDATGPEPTPRTYKVHVDERPVDPR